MAEQFHDTTEPCPCSLPVCATLASCLCFQTSGISIIRAFAVANTESTKWVQSSDTFTMNITVIFYMNRDLGHLSLVIYNQNLKKILLPLGGWNGTWTNTKECTDADTIYQLQLVIEVFFLPSPTGNDSGGCLIGDMALNIIHTYSIHTALSYHRPMGWFTIPPFTSVRPARP